ncbi:Na+/H+ antiporter NhaA [Myxococcus fulvus]|uniref:Na+/H+ antiporter NhaA n=1 Tax=Myxococcus fulvus TaxID=33 RepID=UPI00200B70F6|nr:Na+/H+ antiporter NhaA [Myxococcus fulvus]MCK8500084.1 Na+/H+ antiporter NhaA [Myxococcus fulvus]
MSPPVPSRPTSPPEAWEPLLRIVRLASRPLERFLHIQAASGILLLVAAAVALAWANSPWAESYTRLWHTPVGFRLGAFSFERSLEWVVNDGLMVIFFFVVGMEIRREVHHGELSEWRRAALPIAAALGGMLAPALLYLAFAGAPETKSGWGVPMATDIAFALGILTLLGQRVPPALRVLLLALAVIDDLGAIVVIALFYSSGVSLVGLQTAALGFVGVLAMQWVGVRSKWAYVVPALVAWAGIYAAGIHPTIAGVIVGLMTPVRAWLGPQGLLVDVRQKLETLGQQATDAHSPEDLSRVLRHVDVARREALSPAESLIESLHPWVAYGIMPVFALANAGVQLSGGTLGASAWSVATAVAVGLVVGKPVGVLLAIGATLRLRIGTLPAGLTVRHLVVLGLVAGVGFTMALFIAQLAFTDPGLLAGAKLGVLAASACAAVLALVLGRLLLSPVTPGNAARSADEAESSTEL